MCLFAVDHQVRANVSCATRPVRLALPQGRRTAAAATQVTVCCLYAALDKMLSGLVLDV